MSEWDIQIKGYRVQADYYARLADDFAEMAKRWADKGDYSKAATVASAGETYKAVAMELRSFRTEAEMREDGLDD